MIGSACNYFGYTWEFVTNELSFQNLIMLSASVPSYKKKEEEESKDENLMDFLNS